MKTNRLRKKTLAKRGNWTDCYKVGEFVTFKWNISWLVRGVKYNKDKNKTYIYLTLIQKDNERFMEKTTTDVYYVYLIDY